MHAPNSVSIASAVLLALSSSLAQAQTTDEFTVGCSVLTIQRSDPIVNPGVVSGHTHVVVGGTAFQRTMGADTAKNSKATTCDKDIDRSNYWIPHLYHRMSDGQFEIVPSQGNAAYYLNRACDYSPGATSCDKSKVPLAPPAGLRMVAGDPFRRTYDDSDFAHRAISHTCLKDGPSSETKPLPQEACVRLRSQVFFPSCWDGKNLDSNDHKSHMAYPAIGDYNGGVCPESHPTAIFSVFFEFFFDTKEFPDYQNLVYAMGDPTGYGLHGDFVNGWTDQDALQNAFATCTGTRGENAPECSLGTGQSSSQDLEVAAPEEPDPLGLDGPVAKLPGDNPITGSLKKRLLNFIS